MESNPTEKSPKIVQQHYEVVHYGWKNLIIVSSVIFVLTGTFSYLQFSKIMSLDPEYLILIPTVTAFVTAILNWRYLVKISILIWPIWFTTAMALAFAGMFIMSQLEMPYNKGTYWWIDLLIEYLPAYFSGHWLFSGYSRMAHGKSFAGYLICVVSILAMVFLLLNVNKIEYILQPVFYTTVTVGLCLVHFGKRPKFRAAETVKKP
jgi:hypothetical protein